MNKINSFFSIKTQFENLGDALINRELLSLASMNSNVILDLSRCEREFAQTLTNNFAGSFEEKFGFLNLLKTMIWKRFRRERCFYFLSPGGYFGEITFRTLPSKIFSTVLLFLMWMIGVKVLMVGVSVERMSAGSLILFKIRRKFIHKILVRDSLSEQYLLDRGIKVDGLIPDLAFNLYRKPAEYGEGLCKKLFFSFRTDQSSEILPRLTDLIEACNHRLPIDVDFVFYSQVERDSEGMKNLFQEWKLKASRQVDFQQANQGIDSAISVFNENSWVISNRLHVLLVAGSQGAAILPVIDGKHNEKIKGLFDDINIKPLNVNDVDKVISERRCSSVYIAGHKLSGQLSQVFSEIYE